MLLFLSHGQVDYCAANAFLDAFAQYKTAKGTFTVSIDWDAWQEVGMAVDAGEKLAEFVAAGQGGQVQ
ncbi:MAG: KR domain-containing protein [Hormoscilla sp. GUM202]|nr:KR domain-containing protein [Hormoscilla sp. GUM202]